MRICQKRQSSCLLSVTMEFISARTLYLIFALACQSLQLDTEQVGWYKPQRGVRRAMYTEMAEHTTRDTTLLDIDQAFIKFLEFIVSSVVTKPFFIESTQNLFKERLSNLKMLTNVTPAKSQVKFVVNASNAVKYFLSGIKNLRMYLVASNLDSVARVNGDGSSPAVVDGQGNGQNANDPVVQQNSGAGGKRRKRGGGFVVR